jgi:hypothetical protein
MMLAAGMLLVAATTLASDPPFRASPTQRPLPASYPDSLAATFSICGEARRATSVVDGDSFWHLRVKIRIADIDAPELSPPHCETERMNGEAAKRRLSIYSMAVRSLSSPRTRTKTVRPQAARGKAGWPLAWRDIDRRRARSPLGRPASKLVRLTDQADESVSAD